MTEITPSDYDQSVLQKLPDPHRPWRCLEWRRISDCYHACQDVQQLADGIFGPSREPTVGQADVGTVESRTMGSHVSYSRPRLFGTSAVLGAKPRCMSTLMRICINAAGGCAIRPTNISTCLSALASPKLRARLCSRSGSSARGWRGRKRADKSSWTCG
jgi:hypothetical protein